MKIGTLNVQNIKGNSVYINEILKEIDILLIQEHWMFKFEEREIGNILHDHDFYARYVDEDTPISQKERIRGYGGVATIWPKNIPSHIKPLLEGNNHIAIIELYAKPRPLCIINVYMPCRGGKHTSAEYRDSLDVVREAITKYRRTYTILLGGDLNASLHRPNPNNLDNLLREFCNELSIITPEYYPEEPTFFHHDNKSTSQIDYLLKLQDQNDDGIQQVSIRGQQSTNTSDHVLTTGKMYIKPHKKAKTEPPTTTEYHKPKWIKCDDSRYQSSIDEYLNEEPKCQNDNTNIQLILDIVHLSNTLHTAAETAIPKHKANGKRTQKKKGRTPWNENIGQASRIAKKAHYDWVMEGSPKGQNCMLFNNMKATKKTLRQKQRQAQARIREKKYSDIIKSADLNQKLFFKLVREQRTSHCAETDTLYLDGHELQGDELILKGWNTHFNSLGTPDANQVNEEECLLIKEILEDPEKRSEIPDITQMQVENAISKLANNKAPDHLGLTAEHLKKGGATIVNSNEFLNRF
ncbi:uncharacterized protein LOC134278766 [Saccostrea cucullata]|uniref:uncharacterized protein LOC134278766 n=1 Tax=Saccostrea cuccullata TaxID=36930 RepID=UPI002ED29CCC